MPPSTILATWVAKDGCFDAKGRRRADYIRIAGYIIDTPLRGAYPLNWDQDEENLQNH